MTEIVVCGSRDFDDYSRLREELIQVVDKVNDTIISGGARGADTLAEKFAKQYGIEFQKFEANWELRGRSAGKIRNVEMAKAADMVVAFWDGHSPGTGHMIEYCKDNNIEVLVIDI